MNEIVESLDAGLAKIGPQAAVTFNRPVQKLVTYVKETTGESHDNELSEILGASPKGYAAFPAVWRSACGGASMA
jgi:hypothetical protein